MHFTQFHSRLLPAIDWVDLLPVLLIAAALWGIRRIPKGMFVEDPLNKRQGLALRGIFACVVMLDHLTGEISDFGCIFPRFGYWGPLSVSVFFGLSGYGLMRQVAERPDWRKGFWPRRSKAVWVPYAMVSLFTLLQWWRGDFSIRMLLKDHWSIVRYGWFCPVLFMFYAIFRWADRESHGKAESLLPLAFGGVLTVTLAQGLLDAPWHTVLSNGAFLSGLSLGSDAPTIKVMWSKSRMWIIGLVAMIVALHSSSGLYWRFIAPGSKTLFVFLMNSLFIVGIAALSMKWQMRNRVLSCLGTISYELYLSHGWVMAEIRHWWPEFTGTGYAYAVVAGSLAMASALHGGIAVIKRKTVPALNDGD